MRYSHVIWDFDGTLFDTYPVMAEAFRLTLERHQINEPLESIISNMKVSAGYAKQYYKQLYCLDDKFFNEYALLKAQMELKNSKPFDGIAEICADICSHGGRNYLFTHRGKSAQQLIEGFGMIVYFTELVTSEQNFPRKPSPDALIYLIKKYGISHEDALMIGDRELDILSAKNAGISACYFDDGGKILTSADANIKEIAEIRRVLKI